MQDSPQRPASDEMQAGPWVDRYLPVQSAGAGPVGEAPGMIDMAAIKGMLWRQRFVLAGVIAAVVLLAFIATVLVKPVYQATATVRVEPDTSTPLDDPTYQSRISAMEIQRYLVTLTRVLQSRSMANLVADSLKLPSRPDFDRLIGSPEKPEEMSAPAWRAARREIAAGYLQGNVIAEAPIEERIIEIGFRSEDPQLAATIANAYVENFLTDDLRRSLESNAYAQRYLADQIEQTRIRLQDAEVRVNAFARANRILTQSLTSKATDEDSGGGGETVAISNLTNINEAHTAARANRIAAEQKWLAAASTPAQQIPEVQQSAAIQSLLGEKSKLAAQVAELRQRYGSDYPELREAESQLAALDRSISQQASDIKSGLRNSYQVALRQEQGLSSELSKVSDMSLDEQDKRVHLNLLNREAEALRKQLATMLDRYNQVAASANVRSGNITRLDPAVVPVAPVSPNLIKNLMIALVIGSGLAVAIAILREALDDRLRSASDVESKLGLPLLGMTPVVDDASQAEDNPQLSEAYSTIRSSIDFALPHTGLNVLVMTSSQSGEGKTTTSISIARKYAQLGRKVLLVDADLRKPSVASYFGASRSRNGFVEVLLGQCTFESALLSQPQANLDVLPVGSIPPNPVEVLSSPLVSEFVAKHAADYSLIVFDTSPVMGLADAPLLARLADGIVFIVEANRSHFGQTKTALRRLRDANANVLGVVLTKFRALDAGLSYDYQYSYYSYGADEKS